jgi:hypothetical protein
LLRGEREGLCGEGLTEQPRFRGGIAGFKSMAKLSRGDR